MAELVDPVSQRVVGAHTGEDDLSPVAIELVAQVGDLGAPPALVRLEPSVAVLFAL